MNPYLQVYMQTTYGVAVYGAWLFAFLGIDPLNLADPPLQVLYAAIAAAVVIGLLPGSYLRQVIGRLSKRVGSRPSRKYALFGLAVPALLLASGIASAYDNITTISWTSTWMPQDPTLAGTWIWLVFDGGTIAIATTLLVLNLVSLRKARRGMPPRP